MKVRRSNSAQRVRSSTGSPHSRRPSAPETPFANQRQKDEIQSLYSKIKKTENRTAAELNGIYNESLARVQLMSKRSKQKLKEVKRCHLQNRINVSDVVARYMKQERSTAASVSSAVQQYPSLFFRARREFQTELSRSLARLSASSASCSCLEHTLSSASVTPHVIVSTAALQSYARIRHLCK